MRALKCLAAVLGFLALTDCVDLGTEVTLPPEVDAGAGGGSGGGAGGGSGGGSAGGAGGDETCVEGVVPYEQATKKLSYANFAISETPATVPVGTIVGWSNDDSQTHTVTAGQGRTKLADDAGGFDSGPLAPGSNFAFKFCTPRTVYYFCQPHSNMTDFQIVIE